jgi:predicted Zn-ribbon and HTH transcriptional regulator
MELKTMGRKWSQERFEKEVYDLVGDEYTVLGEYKGSNNKVLIRHNKCGDTWNPTAYNFLRNDSRCPYCSGRLKNTRVFKEEIYDLVGNEYTVLGEYKSSDQPIKMRHNNSKCNNHIYTVAPNNFISTGNRCPKCNGGVSYTHEKFLKEFNKRDDSSEYNILEKYNGTDNKIKLKHLECNKIWKTTPNNILNHQSKCPNCYGNNRKTTEEFKEEIYDLVGNEYTVLGEYKNNKTKILMIHNKCNKKYKVRPRDFLKDNGNRCPYCKASKGELKIKEWLESNNIEFKWQVRNEDCKNKRQLEFDFKIPINEDNYILIEYDGRLHYHPWDQSKKSKLELQQQKENDEIKNKYCDDNNNIELIRIPYWKYENVENILKNKLTEVI